MSSRRNNHHRQRGREARDDSETIASSKPLNALRGQRVLLRVASDTLHAAAAVNAARVDPTTCRQTAAETSRRLTGAGIQSTGLPSVTDDEDAVAVVEKSPSDDCGETDTGCASTSPSTRRACPRITDPIHINVQWTDWNDWRSSLSVCPRITVPVEHSQEMTSPKPEDDVFQTVPRSTLTVASCLVVVQDGRPSVSSSAGTDCTRVSTGSDASPLPDCVNLTAADSDEAARAGPRLAVPSSPPPQSRDRMPTARRQTSRVGFNFQSLTSTTSTAATKPTSASSSKRSRRREKKVTKTLAIVLGKRIGK